MERVEKIKQMLADKPTDAFLLFALAKEYESINADDEAIATYAKLRESNPKYVGLYYHYGQLLAQLEREAEAIILFNEGIELAHELQDQHSLSELQNIKVNVEMGLN